MITMRQVAEIANVSTVTVYRAIKRDDIKKHTFKNGDVTCIDETGLELLISLFNSRKFKRNLHSSNTLNQTDNADKTDIDNEKTINFLMEQVKGLQDELKVERESNRELAERLATIIENQQKLQATQMITDGKAKVSLWRKLFGRKDNSEPNDV